MEKLEQKKNHKHIKRRQIRRNNAKLYPLYKMFAYDLLCFYSVEFLFYTITKGITASEVLIINAFYMLFKILMQIPAVTITDMLGRRKSMIIGNGLVFLYTIMLMISPNIVGLIISVLIRALGFDIKTIVETNLLYDSVSTRGGEGLYSKIDSKGLSWYYWLDGIACLSAGYFFVLNNYLPMILCSCFTLISTLLSFKFKDVYISKQNENEKVKIGNILKEYISDLKTSMKFSLRSKRMRAYTIFGALFYGTIMLIDTYRSDLLVSNGIPEEQYATIMAVLIIIAGISVTLSIKIQKKFRNKTLTFISLTYISTCIFVGVFANATTSSITIPIIIVLFAILKMCTAVWNNLEYKYLKNFTTERNRNKIMFTYELIGGISASLLSIIGSIMLKQFSINQAFLLVSLAILVGIVLTLDYMRTRFGLKPREYKKEDIEF